MLARAAVGINPGFLSQIGASDRSEFSTLRYDLNQPSDVCNHQHDWKPRLDEYVPWALEGCCVLRGHIAGSGSYM